MVAAGPPGRVESRETGLCWRVVFPDVGHTAAASYLRELAASDCSPATIRTYAYALLRWFRFLHERFVRWERAERSDVRAFVEHLRETPNPQRLRRSPDAPPPGLVNPHTGKPSPGDRYAAARSITSSACCSGSTTTPARPVSGRWSTRSRRSEGGPAGGCWPTTTRRRTSSSAAGRPTGRRLRNRSGGRSRTRRPRSCSRCCAAIVTAR
jgi:hypothetical protein